MRCRSISSVVLAALPSGLTLRPVLPLQIAAPLEVLQGDLVSGVITPITHIVSPFIPIIKPLTKSA